MLLTKEKLQHVNTIAHEGKVVVFATDAEGKIHYIIKQDGFESLLFSSHVSKSLGSRAIIPLEFPSLSVCKKP